MCYSVCVFVCVLHMSGRCHLNFSDVFSCSLTSFAAFQPPHFVNRDADSLRLFLLSIINCLVPLLLHFILVVVSNMACVPPHTPECIEGVIEVARCGQSKQSGTNRHHTQGRTEKGPIYDSMECRIPLYCQETVNCFALLVWIFLPSFWHVFT